MAALVRAALGRIEAAAQRLAEDYCASLPAPAPAAREDPGVFAGHSWAVDLLAALGAHPPVAQTLLGERVDPALELHTPLPAMYRKLRT